MFYRKGGTYSLSEAQRKDKDCTADIKGSPQERMVSVIFKFIVNAPMQLSRY